MRRSFVRGVQTLIHHGSRQPEAAGDREVAEAEEDGVDRAVARLQAGDRSGMEILYVVFFEGVWTYANVALGDAHAAEDIAQLTFERAYRSIDRYQPVAGVPFRAWLFRIARNAVIDAGRRKSSIPLDPASIAGHEEQLMGPPAAEPTYEPARAEGALTALRWINDSELALLVDRLPASQRLALTLRYRFDFATQEIAEMMGCTPRAVQDLEYRARRFLSQRLAKLDTTSRRRQRPIGLHRRLRRNPVLAQRRFGLTATPGAAGLQFRGHRGW
jgi:RNA polymerase sigma-70 factor (ECF subfamily)